MAPFDSGVVPVQDYLVFSGASFLTYAHTNPTTRTFYAVCGDHPPTLVDGYAKWGVIDRPLRQGVTVPLGFNPAQMKIELRFGIWDGRFGFRGWDTSLAAGQQVENDIDTLHWMAGGNQEAGASPVVYVNENTTNNNRHLVPPQYWSVGWVLNGGIEWGDSLRDSTHGHRTYQEATFTLLGFLGLGVTTPRPSASQSGGYFRTTPSFRTALAIAGSRTSKVAGAGAADSLARAICTSWQNNPCHASRVSLERRSIRYSLPVGLEVWVPSHAT